MLVAGLLAGSRNVGSVSQVGRVLAPGSPVSQGFLGSEISDQSVRLGKESFLKHNRQSINGPWQLNVKLLLELVEFMVLGE